ncbi:MAG: glycosyltransferase family 39 protein [Phototrophicaceae bacterium]|jgi:hypothetical protein
MNRHKTAHMGFALLMLLLAWGVMLHTLDSASMWLDEDYTWRISRGGVAFILQQTAADVHPPLHYLWTWLWISYSHTDALFVIRLASVIPSLLAVALIYRLAGRGFQDRWAGLGAGTFLAVSGIFIFYAQIVRMYGQLSLVMALTWWALFRLLEGRQRAILGYALAATLAAYTYYYLALGVLAQFIFVLVVARHKIRQFLWAGLIAFLLFAPWLPIVVMQLGIARAQSADPNAPPIGKFLGTLTPSWGIPLTFFEIYSAHQTTFMLLMLAVALVGAFWLRRRWQISLAAWLWLLVPTLSLMGLNTVIPVYGHRYLLFVVPGLAIVIGDALRHLRGERVRGAALIALAVGGLLTYPQGFPEKNIPHRELFQTVVAGWRPQDRVWYTTLDGSLGSTVQDLPEAYHLQFDAPTLSLNDFIWAAPLDFNNIAQVPRVWTVRPYWLEYPNDTEQFLLAGRTLTEVYGFGDYRVRLYESPITPPLPAGDLFTLELGHLHHNQYHAGETVIAKTWWTALQPPNTTYSVSLRLTDTNGNLIGQADRALAVPLGNERFLESAFWQTDERYYIPLEYDLPDELATGEYTLSLVAYYWETPQPLPINGEIMVTLGTFPVTP